MTISLPFGLVLKIYTATLFGWHFLCLSQPVQYARHLNEYGAAFEGVGKIFNPELSDGLKSKVEAKARSLAELWTQQRAASV